MKISTANCRLASLSLLILVASACENSGLTTGTNAGSDADGQQCRAVNAACSSWSDCCSGVCAEGICVGQGGTGGVSGSGGVGGASTMMDASLPIDAGGDTGGPPPWRPSTCDEPEQGQIPNTDQATVARLVVGKWFDCGTRSVFGTSDDIGVEIVNDGTWYKLYWSGTDAVRGVGFGKQGTWSAGSGGICCSVTLNAEGAGGGVAFFPAFATSPQKMQVDSSAGGFQTTLATGAN